MQTTQSADLMSRIRARLLLDHPFFGTLAMRLRIEADPAKKTASIDGVTLRYNPVFMETLSGSEQLAVMAHEVMHCALLHPYRRGTRDNKQWNDATDYAINSELAKAGFALPKGVLIDPSYDGLAAEQIYAKRQQEKADNQDQDGDDQQQDDQDQDQQPGGQQDGDGDGTPNPFGECLDAPKPEPGTESDQPANSEEDWKIAAEQAAMAASKAGKMPGGVYREIKQARKQTEDWKAVLREFIEHNYPSDYSWTSPNRRHIANGLYLPGVVKENTGELVIAFDTSGSISAAMMEEDGAEVSAIMRETRPEAIHVVYCDSQVRHADRYEPDGDDIKLGSHGGGGTAFTPVFEWITEQGIYPKALIYFTDLEAWDIPPEPDFPTLWITPSWVTLEPPFGQKVKKETR